MKKGKLNLKNLEVKSFVTSFEKSNMETVKGGGFMSIGAECTGPNKCCPEDKSDGLFCGHK